MKRLRVSARPYEGFAPAFEIILYDLRLVFGSDQHTAGSSKFVRITRGSPLARWWQQLASVQSARENTGRKSLSNDLHVCRAPGKERFTRIRGIRAPDSRLVMLYDSEQISATGSSHHELSDTLPLASNNAPHEEPPSWVLSWQSKADSSHG